MMHLDVAFSGVALVSDRAVRLACHWLLAANMDWADFWLFRYLLAIHAKLMFRYHSLAGMDF